MRGLGHQRVHRVAFVAALIVIGVAPGTAAAMIDYEAVIGRVGREPAHTARGDIECERPRAPTGDGRDTLPHTGTEDDGEQRSGDSP